MSLITQRTPKKLLSWKETSLLRKNGVISGLATSLSYKRMIISQLTYSFCTPATSKVLAISKPKTLMVRRISSTKPHQSLSKKMFANVPDLLNKNFRFHYEIPNVFLYSFNGAVTLPDGTKIPCDASNFVLRGCSIRNTEHAYGLVAYTGHDTKLMMNSVRAKAKKSGVERIMGNQIIFIFVIQIFICVVSSLLYCLWHMYYLTEEYNYMGLRDRENMIMDYVKKFGNWLLIFTNFVPISLLVTLEMVKFAQGILIAKDSQLVSSEGIATTVQSSNLNEELGQIDHIFSDKTGTLTCNIMEFKCITVNAISYGKNRSYDVSGFPSVTNVDFKDAEFFQARDEPHNEQHKYVKDSLKFLGLCHTVIVDRKGNNLIYNAASPDELALVNFARFAGCEYQGIDENNRMEIKLLDQTLHYKLLQVLEFTSARKRMSVILEDEQTGEVILLCKGADSLIMPRLKAQDIGCTMTLQHLEQYAETGLRTLLLAKRVLTKEEYEHWNRDYLASSIVLEKREEAMAACQEKIEVQMELVGATAIEDKLQDQVGATISHLRETGIKIWVLTGDKIETAINIGFSCNLLHNSMTQVLVDGRTRTEVTNNLKEQMERVQKILEEKPEKKLALIVSGDALIFCVNTSNEDLLVALSDRCVVVLCCRVSPKQKAEVVNLVRSVNPDCKTLAIGDGANDVNMITAAHVGIGIRGVEGQQAARASDYAIGEFKLLKRLLVVHGREAYRRNSHLILYNFFKNVLLVIPQFWYGFMNVFSGQTLYDPILYQCFNIIYASLPIVIYAVFDREYPDHVLESGANLYKQGPKNLLFNTVKFWKWFGFGCWQAGVIAIGCFCPFYSFTSRDANYGPEFWTSGVMVFFCIVIVVNLKILLFTHSYSWLAILGVLASILSFELTLVVFPLFKKDAEITLTEATSRLHGSWTNLVTIIFVIACTTIFDYGYTMFEKYQARTIEVNEEHIRLRSLRQSSVNEWETASKKRPKEKHKGYAFSQEERSETEINRRLYYS
eukprot:TRINITY_DN13822_c0_g1_i4.p1 TRINITY_DN13822_c0_g1~~TRINITY_DN13822_c0_g1_i4.p1  ORF type:complete len:1011 (-),score=95.37 TRINITY_DN13822_c0_g1_i4:124-3156(-)